MADDFEIFAEIDEDLSYEFNTFRVVESKGRLYWGQDSGCSCPTPFEYHSFPGDYTPIEKHTLDRFTNDVMAMTEFDAPDRIELIMKVTRFLRGER